MYRNPVFLQLIVIGTFVLNSCNPDNNITCQAVQTIEPENNCYDPSLGLRLTASGQTESDKSQFTWSIFVANDITAAVDLSAPNEHILVGRETIVVPDSLLRHSPKLVVKVRTNGCGPNELHSTYQTFIKRESNITNCFVWIKQDI